MHINQTTAGRRERVFDRTSRLVLKATSDDERPYLAWLANQVRSGSTHRLYIEEQAKLPGVLDGLTEDEIANARVAYSAICEGVPVPLDFADLEEMEAKGLVRNLVRLPGRGRYAGRFEFHYCDKLEIVVRASIALPRGRAGANSEVKNETSNMEG